MNDKFLIGSHVSMKAPDYFLGSVLESLENNATTLMFYTGAPQNTKRTPLDNCKIEEAINLLKEKNFDLDKIVCHAPYLINLANKSTKEKEEFSLSLLISEINRCAAFKTKLLVLHPGMSLNLPIDKALDNIIDGINYVLKNTDNDVIICIETMAGKGSEVGTSFEQIAYLIKGIENKSRIGVCLDTCHINDAGYDLNDGDRVLDEFDKIIGLNYLKVIHLNDSKNIRGARKDRHANLGKGTIGFDNLYKFAHNKRLENIPKILETPWIGEISPYKQEIEMLRSGKWFDIEK